MKRFSLCPVLLSVACLLASCVSSPRLEYRTLVSAAATADAAVMPRVPTNVGADAAASVNADEPALTPGPALAIEVIPVSVPEVVDRPQLVVRLAGEDGVRVLEQQQWASPLQYEMRNAVSFALSERLGVRDVYNVDRPDLPVYRIAVTVQRFETIIDGSSTLQAAWSVRAPQTDTLLSCQSAIRFASGATVASAVEGYQRAIGTLAGAIAGVVESFAGKSGATCPPATPIR